MSVFEPIKISSIIYTNFLLFSYYFIYINILEYFSDKSNNWAEK